MAIFKNLKERAALRKKQREERKNTDKPDRKSLRKSQKAERKNLKAFQNPERHARKQVRKYEKTVKKDRKNDVKEIRKSEKVAIKNSKKGKGVGTSPKVQEQRQTMIRENNVAVSKIKQENKPKVAKIKSKPVKTQADKPVSFGTAFKNARSAHGGDGGTFIWKGKKYSTNNAKTKPNPKTDNKGSRGTGDAVKNRPNVPKPKKGNGQINQTPSNRSIKKGKKPSLLTTKYKGGGFLETPIPTLFE